MSSKKFADKVMPFLEKYNTYTDKEKILAHYGLETIYILITKMIIMTIVSFILGITKEMYLFMFCYGLLRLYAGGVHLSNSFGCTVMSVIIFIGGTYLCLYTSLNMAYRVLIAGVSICSFAIYSPADTNKKPLIRENDRRKKKVFSTIVCYLFLVCMLFINETYILNTLTYSLLLEAYIITPHAYKLFNQPYNNYMVYGNYKRKEK